MVLNDAVCKEDAFDLLKKNNQPTLGDRVSTLTTPTRIHRRNEKWFELAEIRVIGVGVNSVFTILVQSTVILEHLLCYVGAMFSLGS